MRAPIAAAAFAIVSAPLACTASKVWSPPSVRMPTRFTTTLEVAHRGLDGGRIAHIGLHGVDLADPAQRLQVPRQFRPAHRDANPVVPLGQRPHHVAAQKPRSAEYRDERFLVRCHVVNPAVKRRAMAGI